MKHNRKRTRLKEYDYSSAGVYFLTFCTKNREPLLSIITRCSINNAPTIQYTKDGLCVEKSLNYINDNRDDVHIDYYVIMPNHVHLLVTVEGNNVDNGYDCDGDSALGNRALQAHTHSVGCDILGAPCCDDSTLGNRALQSHAHSVGCDILGAPCCDDSTLGDRALQSHTHSVGCDILAAPPALGIIPQLISSIKRYTTKASHYDLWQSGYHDHIIRDEQDYLIHWKYIDDNPAKWAEDKYYI